MIYSFVQNKEEVTSSKSIQQADKIIDGSNYYESIWFWLLVIVFIVILYLIIKIRNEQSKFENDGVSKDSF